MKRDASFEILFQQGRLRFDQPPVTAPPSIVAETRAD